MWPLTSIVSHRLQMIRALALVSLAFAAINAQAINIQQYSDICKTAMNNIEVPAFDCDDVLTTTEIPMTGTAGVSCPKPPYLPAAGCYKYSRLGSIATGDPKIKMIFLCRHKSVVASTSTSYRDVALIQTNLDTGATCFFQALSGSEDIPHNMPKPNSPAGLLRYLAPDVMSNAGNSCVQCHDGGPFIRTPYVMQAANGIFPIMNRSAYWFPGIPTWNGKVYKVSVAVGTNDNCSACHSMGSNDISRNDTGLSAWLGPMSTGSEQTPYLSGGYNTSYAYWMKPHAELAPRPESIAGSTLYRTCAIAGTGPSCTRTLFNGQVAELHRLATRGLEYGVRQYDKTDATSEDKPHTP